MTNASRVLPGFSCLCVLSFGLYVGTGENCIALWCWRAHKTVSPRKIFLDHFVSCICILVVFIWCLRCLFRFQLNAKICGISCKYPINHPYSCQIYLYFYHIMAFVMRRSSVRVRLLAPKFDRSFFGKGGFFCAQNPHGKIAQISRRIFSLL